MRCAIYIRVSTDKEEQKTSLISQRELFINYIKEKGWEIVDFYVDVDSGTISKRKSLQRLINDAKEKKFDVILAKELSRLARNGGLSYSIREMAQINNIHIITLDNAINTMEGNMDKFGLYAWMYEQESERTSERVKSALTTKVHRGEFNGSIPPYGYIVKDGKLFVRSDGTPDIVKRIFNGYIAGKGFDRIAQELYNAGIPTPSQVAGKSNSGDKWHGSTIRNILENPHYTGDLVQCRSTTISATIKNRKFNNPEDYVIVLDTHEPIISKNDFETVKQLINSRKRIRPQAEKHLFTNTLFCADCGKGMHFKKNRKGYVCGNYNKHGRKACTDHIVRESDLKLTILKHIQDIASKLDNESVMASLDSKIVEQNQRNEKHIQVLEERLIKLKNRKLKAQNKYFDEEISKEEYHEFMNFVNAEINEVMKSKQILEKKLKSKERIINEELKKELEKYLLFNELTSDMLHTLVDHIEIKADGSPRIFYRFSDSSAYSSLKVSNVQHSTCDV